MIANGPEQPVVSAAVVTSSSRIFDVTEDKHKQQLEGGNCGGDKQGKGVSNPDGQHSAEENSNEAAHWLCQQVPSCVQKDPELLGYGYWRKLGSPRLVLAPMVDQRYLEPLAEFRTLAFEK